MSDRSVSFPGFHAALIAATCALAMLTFTDDAIGQDKCPGLAASLRPVANAWQGPAVQITAERAATNAPVLDIGRRAHVALPRASDVAALKLSVPRPKGTEGHAGLLRLRVNTSGDYAVAAETDVWIEIFQEGIDAPLDVSEISRSLRCAGIRKTLSYRLEGGRAYVLQLSESAGASVDVLVQALSASQAPSK